MNNQKKDIEIIDLFFKEFDESSFRIICKHESQEIKRIVDSFNYNIISAITNMRTPFLFAMNYTLLNRWRLIGIKSGLDIKDKELVDNQFHEWLANNWEENLKDIDNELIRFSNKNSINKNTLVDNLLRGAVSIWSAFEVFNKDLVSAIINENPKLVSSLNENTYLKKKLKSPDLNDLIDCGFDMRDCLGTFIFSEIDFSNYDVIKNVKKILFDTVKLDSCLYKLNQIRHITVHRSGIIDEKFENNTDTHQKNGDKLLIEPKDIRKYLNSIKEYVENVLIEIKN